jgi:hypothetical protein
MGMTFDIVPNLSNSFRRLNSKHRFRKSSGTTLNGDAKMKHPSTIDTAPIAYSPARAAEVAGRTRTRIFKALKTGELAARKDGRSTLIEHTELARWVSSLPMRSTVG